MADRSFLSEMPDVAETAQFLRRFADLMSNGQNATYLLHAAELLETLTARAVAEINEVTLWRQKYDAVSRHVAELEAESEMLRHDIDGHVNVATLVMNERDALELELKGKEVELLEFSASWDHERSELAAKLTARETEFAEFRAAFGRQRDAFEATANAQAKKLEELRCMAERERAEFKTSLETTEMNVAKLRLVLEEERAEFQLKSRASADELEAFRLASQHESEELQAKVTLLEFNRAQLRSAFKRISELRDQTTERLGDVGRDASDRAEVNQDQDFKQMHADTVEETDTIVPKATLRQVRDQFEYLAQRCIPPEDIASRVMCELGAHTMNQILTAGARSNDLSASEIVENVLDRSGSTARVMSPLV